VAFTDILTMGSVKEKADYSFKLLDIGNKGFINENDIYQMMSSVFEVWNIMTNSKVIVLPEYVKHVYRQLDKDGDGSLTLTEYQNLYMQDKIVFGWFEYLNQEEYFVKQMLEKELRQTNPANSELNKRIDQLKGEIGDTMKLLIDIENKSATASPISTPRRSRAATPNITSRSETGFKLNLGARSMTPGVAIKTDRSTRRDEDEDDDEEQSGAKSERSIFKSKILTSKIKAPKSGISGPQVESIEAPEHPMGDIVPIDPTADDADIEEYLSHQQIYEPEPEPPTIDIKDFKERLAKIAGGLKRIENVDLKVKDDGGVNAKKDVDNFEEAQKDPTRRQLGTGEKRSLGLFFGHENWSLLMNMMIGFRAGLKT
jgi:hypothetical protein